MDLIARKEEVTQKLKKLKDSVLPEDKSAAHIEYGINPRTSERYLNGEVSSLLIANTLYVFFKKCVKRRDSKTRA